MAVVTNPAKLCWAALIGNAVRQKVNMNKKIIYTIKIALLSFGFVYIAYHFYSRVLLPTFMPEPQHMANDFASYYVGSKLLLEGETPYRSIDKHRTIELSSDEMQSWNINKNIIPAYIYPSFLAAIISPLTKLPFNQARFIWELFCLMTFFGVVWFTFFLLGKQMKFDFTSLIIIGVFFASMPTLETLTQGQINYQILLLILLAFYFERQNKSILGGVLLGIATLIKVSPIIMLLYFVHKKDFKFIQSFLIFSILALSLLYILFPNVDYVFISNVLPSISSKPSLNNKAISVWWQYLFLDNEYINPIIISPITAKIFTITTAITILIITYLLFFKGRKYASDSNSPILLLEYVALILSLMLLQPYLQIHHLVFSFIAIAFIVNFYSNQKANILKISLLVLSFILINGRGYNSFEKIGAYWYSIFICNPQIIGLLILSFLLFSICKRHFA